MKEKHRRILFAVFGVIFGILLELFLTVHALQAGKWQESMELDLGKMIGESQIQLEGCEWEDGALVSKERNAMLLIYGTGSWGRYELYFEEPFEEPTTSEWYYASADEVTFDRFRRQDGYIMPGTTEAEILIPGEENGNVRINIHGNFRLSSIRVAERLLPGQISLMDIAGHIHAARMLLFIAFCLCGSLIYADERGIKKQKNETGGRHYVYLDGIRVLAAFLVIVVHVIEPLGLLYPMGSKRYILLESLSAVSLNCNVLFVMISGALLLPWKEESWGAFFRKRFLKVLVPLMVYGVFYIRFCCISKADPVSWIRYGILTMISGNFVKGPHLWLIYVLLGLYIIVIPFRFMLQRMPERSEKILTLLILFCLGANTISKVTGNDLGIPVFLGEWPGIFLMGYMLNQTWMRKYDNWLILGGIAAFAVSVSIISFREHSLQVIANESILSTVMASAVFAVLIRLDGLLRPVGKILAVLSRYSYSVILIHWFVLIQIVYNGWFSSNMNQYLQVVFPILWCGILSAALSWIIDRMIVDVLMNGKIWKTCRKLF